MKSDLKKHLLRLVLVLTCLSTLESCASKLDDIRMTSCSLVSLTPTGSRSADVVIEVGIDNPAFTLVVTDFEGVLKSGLKQAGTFTTDSLTVEGKTSRKYTVPVSVSLDKNLSLGEVMKVFAKDGLSGFKLDLSAKVTTKRGVGTTLTLKDIYLSKFIQL